jgi:hypothetical protein
MAAESIWPGLFQAKAGGSDAVKAAIIRNATAPRRFMGFLLFKLAIVFSSGFCLDCYNA